MKVSFPSILIEYNNLHYLKCDFFVCYKLSKSEPCWRVFQLISDSLIPGDIRSAKDLNPLPLSNTHRHFTLKARQTFQNKLELVCTAIYNFFIQICFSPDSCLFLPSEKPCIYLHKNICTFSNLYLLRLRGKKKVMPIISYS